jgi:hypothetical protein
MGRPKKKEAIELNLYYSNKEGRPSKPHEGQQHILDELDKGTRWVMIRAGRKWNKTSLLISWGMEQVIKSGLNVPFIAPNKVQAKNIVWDDHVARLLYHFKEIGFPYKTNENELTVQLPHINKDIFDPNGGKLQLFGVENADSLRGISNWGAAVLDEYDDWTEDIWPLIIRPNLAPHMAPAIIAGTPKGFKNLYRIQEQGLFRCFHYTSYDNPYMNREELEAMEKEYKSLGMAYYRQEILAEYERPYGTVYEEWSSDNYREFDYDPFLPVHISIDFGVNDPTALIWIQPNNGEFRVIDYYEASDANVEHFVSVIRSKPYKKADLYTGDAAGKARSITTNTSPIDDYGKFGIHIRTKDGLQIPDQIRLTHKYIPMLILKQNKTERLRDCLMNYRYPTKKSTIMDQSNEIPVHDEWSHGCRALEYYFANIHGGGLMRSSVNTQFHNKEMRKKWTLGQKI